MLHIILREGVMIGRAKRNQIMKRFFRLCMIRKVKIESAGGSILGAFFSYISPEDQLKRLLDDSSTFQQYMMSGELNKMYDGLGKLA